MEGPMSKGRLIKYFMFTLIAGLVYLLTITSKIIDIKSLTDHVVNMWDLLPNSTTVAENLKGSLVIKQSLVQPFPYVFKGDLFTNKSAVWPIPGNHLVTNQSTVLNHLGVLKDYLGTKQLVIQNQSFQSSVKSKIILLYCKPMYILEKYFKLINCSYKCDISTKRSDISSADAVIFSPRLMWDEAKRNMMKLFPKDRKHDQYWVFFMFDLHWFGHFGLFGRNVNIFNLSMTWKHDADIRIGYGYLELLPIEADIQEVYNAISLKTKLIFWVVGNCHTLSKREWYTKELSKYIQVDIYGKCGNYCDGLRYVAEKCFEMKGNDYKFYLAFENSICPGYVTEKVFRLFKYNIIPIVLGGTNYSAILPERSYINVLDFQTPKLLAEYLLKLNEDQDLYKTYFQWKKKYIVRDSSYYMPRGVCDLCQLLHDPNHPKKTIANITQHVMHDCNDNLIPAWQQTW